MRVLVVEDEPKVADALKEGLEAERYDVVVERTGEGAFFRTSTEVFDIVLLDLALPGRDGLEILTTIRSKDINVSVIVLTARDTVPDRVAGLDAGADDYLVKPFAFAELLARMRALGRRGRVIEIPLATIGSLMLDRATHTVSRNGEPIDLTTREFELLEYLMRHEGQVVSREALAREVWNETGRSTSLDNVIDVHIARLRRKVDTENGGRLIHTVRGVGYILNDGEP
jgi:DNA-binding response OmpR family regulator